MYQLSFYVPESHLDVVKNALFARGAGRLGHYDQCAWQVKGEGQFRALEHSQPFIGNKNALTKVIEYKVEMICADEYIDAVVATLKEVHPYEEPAYSIVKIQ